MKALQFLAIIALLHLFAGCQDKTSEPTDKSSAPRFGFITPDADSTLYVGTIVNFQAQLIDPDQDFKTLKLYINEELLVQADNSYYALDTLYLTRGEWLTDQCQPGRYKVHIELFDQQGHSSDTTYYINLKPLFGWKKTFEYGPGFRAVQCPDSSYTISSKYTLTKLNQQGNRSWNVYNNFHSENWYSNILVSLPDNGCYAVSQTYGTGDTLRRLNSDGSVYWKHPFRSLGNIAADQDQNVYAFADSGLYKLSANGELIWRKEFKGLFNLLITPERQFLMVGYTSTYYSPNFNDTCTVHLLKADLNGTIIWQKDISLPCYNITKMEFIRLSNGNYVIGYSKKDDSYSYWSYCLTGFNSEGNIIYDTVLQGYNEGYIRRLTPDKLGGFFLTCFDGIDRFDSNGKRLSRIISSNNNESIYDMVQTLDGKYLLTGDNHYYLWAAKIETDLDAKESSAKKTSIKHVYLQKKIK